MATVSTHPGRLLRFSTAVAASMMLWMSAGLGLDAADGAELVMFEREGCPFCARFDREIAPSYPRSAAGAKAPLRQVDLSEDRTGGIAGLEPAVFAPTFVLVDGGREIGRLIGYPGQRYFYAELQSLIDRLPDPSGRQP